MKHSTDEDPLEIVDENDRVVGVKPRFEVHRRQLRHRSVHLFIFDSRGHLYLQKRSPRKDQYPGHWDSSAAGHPDPGETPEAAAHRELREELGIDPALSEILRHPACRETGWEFVTLFRGQTAEAIHLNLEEADEGRYFSPGEVGQLLNDPHWKVAPGFRLLYALYRKQVQATAPKGPGCL